MFFEIIKNLCELSKKKKVKIGLIIDSDPQLTVATLSNKNYLLNILILKVINN